MGAFVSRWMLRDALGAASPQPTRAKAMILLWMNGGPSHVDTWDPKPGTPVGGPFKAIKTKNPKLEICEHLPQLAAIGDKLSVVRGMTSKEGNHQRAQYLLHTGYAPNPTVVHPSLGAWTSRKLGAPAGGLPSFVSLGGPSHGAGFFGPQHGPFVVPKAGAIPPNVAYGPGANEERFDRRRALLESMEQHFDDETGDAMVAGRRAVYDKAVGMMKSLDVEAFDVSDEPESVRAAFGDTDFGRACLVASRLVSKGVRFVEVVLDGWDTHQDNFERTKKLMATLDLAMSGLIEDLEVRGLLKQTLVVWMGDFGRTPRINANDGRDHHPAAWSAVLAGGGSRSGIVLGDTGPDGDKVVKDPVSVPNLMATFATLLGMDPGETVLSPTGRPIALTDGGSAVAQLVI
jgi:uncharacterized protein (DUF1501 family)